MKKVQKFSETFLTYCCKEASKMSDDEIKATARLFSENYGEWSGHGRKPGCPIQFSPNMIKASFVDKPDRFVALVYYNNVLIGHAFYLRRHISQKGKLTWILQLVVDKKYRGYSIGTKLMHSIWQLSDSYAWGLYTANPQTIKALENSTMRQVNVRLINRRFKKISPYLDDLLANDWISSYTPGMVNTQFHIDHGNLSKKIAAAYADGKFPLNQKLPEGHEWLAIVFSDQQPYLKNENQLTMYLEYSKSVLVHAYSMMNMRDHGWTRYTEEELSFLSRFVFPNCRVLDVGCGTGRLTNGLARKGASVHGIDFSKKQLEIAEEAKVEDASFQLVDARKYSTRKKYDRVICMYDVVGSFPDEKDNLRILKKIYKNLKPGGIAVLSVMNMELTRKNCQIKKNVVPDIYGSIDRLLRLKGSNTMQSTGDVFNGEFIIIDDSTGLCYRKEQFFSENYLPLEYLIRDRRYTKQEISRLVQKVGFDVEECYCFRAGFLEDELKSTDPHAKEILVVARKPNKGKFFH